MDSKSSPISPSTTVDSWETKSSESLSPFQDSKPSSNIAFNFEDDRSDMDLLDQYESTVCDIEDCSDHRIVSDSVEEEAFWNSYESAVRSFCYTAVINQSNSIASEYMVNGLCEDKRWSGYNGTLILSTFFGFQLTKNEWTELTKEKTNLRGKLEAEIEKSKYYYTQMKFYRDKANDLEWKFLENTAKMVQQNLKD